MTPERENKIKNVLSNRQDNLLVVLENVWDPHNVSAVMRSCDAVGVQNIVVLNTEIPAHKHYGAHSSASARKWVEALDFDNVADCVDYLREKGFKIYTTHLSADAQDLYEMDLTQKVALVFGNERKGVSEEMLKAADGNFIIPQLGMIQSLNISVACAVTLYEALRQRKISGCFDHSQLSPENHQRLLEDWTSNFRNKNSKES